MLDIRILLLNTLPECLVAEYLGLAFFGIKLKTNKYLLLGIIIAILNFIAKSLISNTILNGFQVLIYVLTLIIAYRYIVPVRWGIASASSLMAYSLIYSSKFILLQPILNFFNTNYDHLSSDIWLTVKVNNGVDIIAYLSAVIVFLTGFKIAEFSIKSSNGDVIDLRLKTVEKRVLIIVNIILVNVFLSGLLIIYLYLSEHKVNYFKMISTQGTYLVYSNFSFVIIIGTFILIFNILKSLKIIKNTQVKEALLESQNDTINYLLQEKEDFKKQLGIIASLIKGENTDKLNDFLLEISDEIATVGRTLNIEKHELAALLLQKAAKAKSLNISIQYTINSSLKNLSISSSEIVRVIGNLLDNAIDALKIINSDKKEILLNIFEKENKFIFEIYNNEPIIPKQLQSKIFQKGVSTKNKEGHGYGLAIVKDIVDKNLGQIILSSEEGRGTLFSVTIPISIEE